MYLDIRDERMLDLVEKDATRTTLSEQFEFTEGPIWHPHDQTLIFSDIPANKMYRWDEQAGVALYRDPSHKANGNTYDRQGNVLTCEHATSRVVKANGGLEIVASHYQGKELNSPNDIVVKQDGTILFTDPMFGRMDTATGVKRDPELDFTGVYAITPQGELKLLSKDFESPNGLCLSLDETHLYVADTLRKHVRKFVFHDDELSGGEVFCNSPAPDGLKIDSLGNLYAGGPSGVGVYAADGTWLGVFKTPEFCANFTWGVKNLTTLFLTASTGLYQFPVKVPGIPLF